MDPEFAKITLEQLLSHSSGLTDMPAIVDLVNRSYQQDGNMDEVRYWMLKQIAPKPLAIRAAVSSTIRISASPLPAPCSSA